MGKLLFAFVLSIIYIKTFAQSNPPVNKDQLLSIAENNNDAEITDDSYLQDLQYFIIHKINLNIASAEELKELRILNSLQIDNLISYRKLLGKLIDIHELQAIPGWNMQTIQNLLPYIYISNNNGLNIKDWRNVLHGSNSLMSRYSQVLQVAKGFNKNDTTSPHYLGSAAKIFFRYKYNYKNIIQYGITASKDAGEQFFKASQKNGFDFYSLHVYARNVGFFKVLALGDYAINMGQGLIQWQTLGFKKSTEVINIERQAEIIKSYNSSGQVNYHSGVAFIIKNKKVTTGAFLSYRKLDANFKTDSLGSDFVTSLQSSGYHRTANELSHANKLTQLTIGGTIGYSYEQFHIGINSIHYNFGLPIKKSAALYNKFAFSGTSLFNNSLDYSYTVRNFHLFGELAIDNDLNKAIISGIIMAMDKKVDLSFLYRNISPSYHSFYSNAFTENTTPVNEKGFYSALSIAISSKVLVKAYADMFSFPWVKYRVDLPSAGSDYLLQVIYNISKQFKCQTRYRLHNKPMNFNPDTLPISPVLAVPIESMRSSFNYSFINMPIELGSLIEFMSFNKNEINKEKGMLLSFDLACYPNKGPFDFGATFSYFNTTGSNSKIYNIENDVLYSFSGPSYSGKGISSVFNFNYRIDENLSGYINFTNTYFPGLKKIGTGLNQIQGNKKTEIKFQLIYKF